MNISSNSIECKADWDHISSRKELVIQGFLSLGEKDHRYLRDGGHYETALRFNRYSLNRFWTLNSVVYSEYTDIFQKTLGIFSCSEDKDYIPRMRLDNSIRGWYQHYVTRLIGNVASKYQPNGPFFEIIINSQIEFPFNVCILQNSEVAEARYEQLKALSYMTQDHALKLFRSSKTTSPHAFLKQYRKQYGKKPGKNATQLLKALTYLNSKKMSRQIVGNCWAKQAKRIPLISLFVETVSSRPELTIRQSWKLAQKLYRFWKKDYLCLIEEMVNGSGINPHLISPANRKINYLREK